MAEDGHDGEARLARATELDDQAALVELARTHAHVSIRRKATAHLKDQAVLRALATQDPNPWVRAEAVARIQDQADLAAIAFANARSPVANAAVQRLADEAALQELRARHPNARVRTRAAERLATLRAQGLEQRRQTLADSDDQELLLRLALEDADPLLRVAAVERLDEAHLWRVISQQSLAETRVAAVARVADVEKLSSLARTDPNPLIRAAAVARLDEEHRWRIIDDAAVQIETRVVAVHGARNQERLRRLAERAAEQPLRLAAVDTIESPAVVAEILKSVRDDAVVANVIKRLESGVRQPGVSYLNPPLPLHRKSVEEALKVLAAALRSGRPSGDCTSAGAPPRSVEEPLR